jgi:quercetin dioxygenase-like cupin family protein
LKWVAAPPAFPKGAQIAIVSGDPAKEGLYVVRLKVPAGYKVPAHVHPNDENVTVLSGTFNIGMGDKLDETKGTALKAGGFAQAPKGMQHYAWFTEDTIIQVHGMGAPGSHLRQCGRRSAQEQLTGGAVCVLRSRGMRIPSSGVNLRFGGGRDPGAVAGLACTTEEGEAFQCSTVTRD